MEPVLVFTDTERITKEKEMCDASVSFIQGFYDLIAALGITFTIQEMVYISGYIIKNHLSDNCIENLVKRKLLAKVSGANFNGVALSDSALYEMIEMPDVSNIYTYVKENYPKIYIADRIGITEDYLLLIDGIVSKKNTAYTTIESLYTQYTKNDKGAELATLLFSICNLLNEYEEYLGRIPNPYPLSYRGVYKDLEGIEFVGLQHRPSLRFIRETESVYPDYVAA